MFFFQAEDGIRDLVRSRGLGDVYKRQVPPRALSLRALLLERERLANHLGDLGAIGNDGGFCLLYTSDAADERSSVDLGGRRIIKKTHDGNRRGRDSHDVNNKTDQSNTRS